MEIKAGGVLSGRLKVEAVRSVKLELGYRIIPIYNPNPLYITLTLAKALT